MGYNIASGEDVPVQVTEVTKESVDFLLKIRHEKGYLKITPVNQPIYMRNETYTGWLVDPINLKIGDEIFHVPTHTWVKIKDLKLFWDSFEVYDVVTDPFNVFVGNGILLDKKVF